MAISPSKRLEVYKRDNYHCVVCGSMNRLTIDHIIPIDKGGMDGLENLQTMCFPCNFAKGNHLARWWHKFIPFVNWREHNKARNEMLGAMTSKDVLLERRVESRMDKRLNDFKPKATQDDLALIGLKNANEAYGKRSEERDIALRHWLKILAKRVDELEEKYESNTKG